MSDNEGSGGFVSLSQIRKKKRSRFSFNGKKFRSVARATGRVAKVTGRGARVTGRVAFRGARAATGPRARRIAKGTGRTAIVAAARLEVAGQRFSGERRFAKAKRGRGGGFQALERATRPKKKRKIKGGPPTQDDINMFGAGAFL